MEIKAQRFPWQLGYGWKSSETKHWMKSRFGGGWDFKLGIDISFNGRKSTILLNLGIGLVQIRLGR